MTLVYDLDISEDVPALQMNFMRLGFRRLSCMTQKPQPGY